MEGDKETRGPHQQERHQKADANTLNVYILAGDRGGGKAAMAPAAVPAPLRPRYFLRHSNLVNRQNRGVSLEDEKEKLTSLQRKARVAMAMCEQQRRASHAFAGVTRVPSSGQPLYEVSRLLPKTYPRSFRLCGPLLPSRHLRSLSPI